MGVKTQAAWKVFSSNVFDYETQKVVQINSLKIGITYRLIQLGIVLYVAVWVMYYEKGYQAFDEAVSGVTAKLKGVAYTNLTDTNIGATVWDAADYVIPPQQRSAFFVMTNLVMTPGQTLRTCEESHDIAGNDCTSDKDCNSGNIVMLGSGVQTGRCVASTRKANLSVCEIYGWCPTEYDVLPKDFILANAPNFTVMLKNSIEFPRYHIKRRNILGWMDKKFLSNCRYNPNSEKMKYCPIFRLGDIMEYTEAEHKHIWNKGGMVSIHIEWNCDLDYNEEQCLPKYIFRRLDDFDSPVGKGWNFRFSHHYMEGNVHKRNLVKAYGIQFFITVYVCPPTMRNHKVLAANVAIVHRFDTADAYSSAVSKIGIS
uniref:ATP receptor n=1 Tax=Mesocestoides corti TaxID=53468 RepID=A0A5K3FK95_MESCO